MADWVTIVPPRDPWPFSTVTADDLDALVAEGLLRPLSGDSQPEWMPPPSGAAPSPPPGYVVSFVSFHERGFGVPASRFMRAILHVYGVELHNLSPNSISQAAIFAAVCEGYLGIDPHWDLWTHFFSAELFASPTGERRVRTAVRVGGCILQLRQARAPQYIPAILASSNKGWQRRWFYLRNDDGRLPSFSQRVVTATVALRDPARQTEESPTPSEGPGGVAERRAHRCGSGCRHSSPEGASLDRAAAAALGDDAGGRLGGFANVLGSPSHRRPPQVGSHHVGEAGRRRPFLALDASRPQVCVPGECPLLLPLASDCPWFSRPRLFVCLQEVGYHKPSRPPVPEDAVDRATRRVAAEKRKEKKDAKKAWAHERMRARDALERLHRRQERDGLLREPSPETPDDDDDEDDDMAACLGLSPDLRLGQGSSSQPPSGLVPSVSGAGTSGSRSEERGQTEGVLDPSAGEVEVTPGGQAELPVPREPSPVPAAQQGDPQVVVAAPGQSVSRASRAPKARMVPKLAARKTLVVPSGVEVRETSPQARLIMARSG
jgi:hypothetical protein